MIMSEIHNVVSFATNAHEGQLRKYTDVPYIIHPISVAFIVASVNDDPDVIAAALLHDILEDTNNTIDDLLNFVGGRITEFVMDVTDVSKPSDGNRKIRKEIDREHLAAGSPEAKTIKLADIIDNSPSVIKYDKGFAEIYIEEKKKLLPYLVEGNAKLYKEVDEIITNYFLIN